MDLRRGLFAAENGMNIGNGEEESKWRRIRGEELALAHG